MRNQSVQSWRGIAIIAVLLIHLSFLKRENEDVFLITRQVLNFAVPLFFFISGYFAKFSDSVNWKGIKRLFIPYLLWSVISYSMGEWDLYRGREYYYDQYNIVEVLLFGYSSMQMYYLTALIGLVFVTPFIYRYKDMMLTKILCLAATPVCVLINYWWRWRFSEEIQYLTSVFIFHLTYFYLGLMSRERTFRLTFGNGTLLLVAFAAIYIGVIESRLLTMAIRGGSYAGPYRMCGMVFCLSVIAIAYKEISSSDAFSKTKSILAAIGDYSFIIYLSHLQVFRGGTSSLVNSWGKTACRLRWK
ncbi:MAG: acyltransferase [Prevotella sp.]|nr:acyltransferase [Prevotella sp.]